MVFSTLRSRLPIPRDSTPSDASLDTIFRILRNKRRRYTLHYLKRVDDRVSLRDLVEAIAAWENDKDREALTDDERQRVHVSMLQSHLPAMIEAGLVESDSDRGTVRLTREAQQLDIYLEVVPEGDIDWGEYYLGVTVFNTVIFGLAWTEFYPFGALPVEVWVAFIPGVFLLAAVLHYWYQQKHQLGSGPAPSG